MRQPSRPMPRPSLSSLRFDWYFYAVSFQSVYMGWFSFRHYFMIIDDDSLPSRIDYLIEEIDDNVPLFRRIFAASLYRAYYETESFLLCHFISRFYCPLVILIYYIFAVFRYIWHWCSMIFSWRREYWRVDRIFFSELAFSLSFSLPREHTPLRHFACQQKFGHANASRYFYFSPLITIL